MGGNGSTMINGNHVLGIIPARGGSKGVPRKNIRNVGGKPLIAWTIEAGLQSRYIDRLILSSEDSEIIAIAERWGCQVPYIRSAELAGDNVPGIAPVLDALERISGYDYLVLLQPTSPLRTVADIDNCIEFCAEQKAPSCVSVTEADDSPHWMYQMKADSRLRSLFDTGDLFPRRQDLPEVYVVNGAIYVARCDWLMDTKTFLTPETVGFAMPKERAIDLDTSLDFDWLEFVLMRRSMNG